MSKRFYILAFLFSVLILASACAGNEKENDPPNGKNAGDPDSQNGEIEQNATERLQPELPGDLDFKGETFLFLVTGPNYGYGYYSTIDIYTEQQNGETLNDAVYTRNRNIEQKLNVNIADERSNSVAGDASKAVKAGEDAYGAIFAQAYECATLAQGGIIGDIKEMPYIDLSKPWWDQNAANDLVIKNKLYFTAGDISTMIKACTRLIIFNKKLMKDFALGDPYEYVKNNTWTYDIYAQMVKSVYVDVNGDGTYDDADIYGAIMENHSPYYLSVGFGERLTTNDADGIPQITFNTDRLYGAAEKLWDLYFDESVCRNVGKMKQTGGFTNVYTYARSLFADDKFLFHIAGPLILSEFRNMESDFGLLPMPKLDSNQSRYYHAVDPDAAMLSIPVTCNPEETGALLEAMTAESMYTLTPAYNEVLLKRKYVRDDESEFILDIVNTSRTYDLCRIFGWGGLNSVMDNLTGSKKRTLASEIEKIYDKARAAIEKTADAFE